MESVSFRDLYELLELRCVQLSDDPHGDEVPEVLHDAVQETLQRYNEAIGAALLQQGQPVAEATNG